MNERGFTLLELIIAMAVSGMVMAAVVPAIFQTVQGTSRISGNNVALLDIESAAHWLTRDLIQAQTTDLVDSAPPVSQVTLNWNDLTTWAQQEGTVSHAATYTYSGTKLLRNFDGQVTTVGKYLTSVEFSITGRMITITLTSSPDSFVPRPVETRTYLVYLRPDAPL